MDHQIFAFLREIVLARHGSVEAFARARGIRRAEVLRVIQKYESEAARPKGRARKKNLS